MSGKGTLDVYCSAYRVASAGKNHEKGIALRVYLLPMPLPKGCSLQESALLQESIVACAHLLQEARGTFNIGEEQGERSRRQLRHNWLSLSSIL